MKFIKKLAQILIALLVVYAIFTFIIGEPNLLIWHWGFKASSVLVSFFVVNYFTVYDSLKKNIEEFANNMPKGKKSKFEKKIEKLRTLRNS